MDTVATSSEARRVSGIETAAPNSDACRFSEMEIQSPPTPEGPESTSLNIPGAPAEADVMGPSEIGGARTERSAELVPNGSGEFSDDKRQTQGRISSADKLPRVFSFISQIPVKKLRALLKHWGQRQGGNKSTLAAKAFLHVQLSLLSGKNLLETLSTHDETKRYESWLRARLQRDENYPVTIQKAPAEADLLELLAASEAAEYRRNRIAFDRARSRCNPNQNDGAGRNADHPAHETSTDLPNPGEETARSIDVAADYSLFSISEFARLLIIMREDEDARAAVIGLGQQLSRAQLDARITRADLWPIVESMFNSPSVNHFLNMTGFLDGVNSSLPPQRFRSAAFLKDKFNDVKASFTAYVSRWLTSGKNDPERFNHFLPKVPNSELNALGKRMMVMFVCTTKGTPHEEVEFTNGCCKLIPDGAERDEGSNQGGSIINEGERERHVRKRKSYQDSDGIKDMASSISKLASSYEKRKEAAGPTESHMKLKEYSCRLKRSKSSRTWRRCWRIYQERSKLYQPRALQGVQRTSAPTDGEVTIALALKKLQEDMGKYLLPPPRGDELEA